MISPADRPPASRLCEAGRLALHVSPASALSSTLRVLTSTHGDSAPCSGGARSVVDSSQPGYTGRSALSRCPRQAARHQALHPELLEVRVPKIHASALSSVG